MKIEEFVVGDVEQVLSGGGFDLIFADPPFNVGKEYYSVCDEREDYFEWCERWIKLGFEQLKDGGSFYLMNNVKNIFKLYNIMERYGDFQSQIVWYKRVNPTPSKRRYPASYDCILFFSKGEPAYFDSSERIRFELNSKGDTSPHQPYDCWLDIPKVVSGIFAVEAIIDNGRMILPNQLPVRLLMRIIQTSCPEDGIVCDPFCGTGTTARACRAIGRSFVVGDIDRRMVEIAKESLENMPARKLGEYAVGLESFT